MNTKQFLVLPLAAAFAFASMAATAQSSAPRRPAVDAGGTLNGNVLIRRDGIFLRCTQCGTVVFSIVTVAPSARISSATHSTACCACGEPANRGPMLSVR